MLEAHNKYRAQHGAPPMEIDVEAARSAREWAKYMEKAGMQHAPFDKRNACGENLATMWGSA